MGRGWNGHEDLRGASIKAEGYLGREGNNGSKSNGRWQPAIQSSAAICRSVCKR